MFGTVVVVLVPFRMFLEGIPFVMVTDCNSLALTLNKKQINPRKARWTLEFESFNYTVRHRAGEHMAHIDALSRLPTICTITENEVDLNIQVAQSRDLVINKLKQRLEQTDVSGYKLENGLVFRVSDQYQQLYVPGEMEESVMRMMHENYGHLGIDKCANQIQKHYWFPFMREKLNRFIRNCLKCIFYSALPRSNEQNLYSIPKKSEPWDTLHIDHFGPLESIGSKHKHVLVVIDAFNKFTKLYAVNTGAKESICVLKKYFLDYSRPMRILHDQGKGFTSNEFKEFCGENGITYVVNAVASP